MPISLTSLFVNAMFASSACNELRNDPSPNLFNSTSGGNSHSINVGDGRESADLIPDMACLSRVWAVLGMEGFEKRHARVFIALPEKMRRFGANEAT